MTQWTEDSRTALHGSLSALLQRRRPKPKAREPGPYTETVTVRLSYEENCALRDMAEREERPLAFVLRRLLREEMAR